MGSYTARVNEGQQFFRWNNLLAGEYRLQLRKHDFYSNNRIYFRFSFIPDGISRQCNVTCFADNFVVLNIFSAFNWYNIDGAYRYMEMKNILEPFFIFIPFGFIFSVLFGEKFFKKIFWISIIFSVLFALLQLVIAYFTLFFPYKYGGMFHLGEIPLYIIGFLCGFFLYYGLRFLLLANKK